MCDCVCIYMWLELWPIAGNQKTPGLMHSYAIGVVFEQETLLTLLQSTISSCIMGTWWPTGKQPTHL